MKIMAIDYGDARTGIAISDLTGSIVGTTLVIHQRNADKAAEEIRALVEKHGVQRLVMGWPKNMDGTESLRADLYRAFAQKLQTLTGLEPVLWDERWTTVAAHNILTENNRHGKKRKNTVDAVAASLILEGYLASL
jgi:putative Holliday junction resolvase